MVKNLKAIQSRVWRQSNLSFTDLELGLPLSVKSLLPWVFSRILNELGYQLKEKYRGSFGNNGNGNPLQNLKTSLNKLPKNHNDDTITQTVFYGVRPNTRAGIGHQLSSVFAGLMLAKQNNWAFAISGLSKKWDEELGFNLRNQQFNSPIEKVIRLSSVNYQTHRWSADSGERFGENIGKKNTLIWGPYDHSEENLIEGGLLLRDIYVKRWQQINVETEGRVVVHIRRPKNDSDDLGNRPQMQLKDVIRALKLGLEESDNPAIFKTVTLLSTDVDLLNDWTSEISKIANLPIITTKGCCEVGAFKLMANASMLVGSASGLSYAAGLLSRGKVLFPSRFWHTLPTHWNLY